ncbi:glutamate-5-semialdehyde dehydrogenase [Campylobacter vicugnae]|uniref:Gamma-glutamyl phosphate reductase n=1 Tax=Campylobacter vicugnae TaxID=1660076 RepID=A0A1X9T085_9BACT|nr:glutamate-5-semialdehyde dehydrogenase [Campylobacter sp. RM8964]ARR01846.1 glutamate-5-semialdehyde dehydrogenase [Campylobacter sp. RM8964]
MENRLKELKKATKKLQILNQNQRANLIQKIADAIENNIAKIIEANAIDLQNAKNLSSALQDRLKLDEVRIKSLADGIRDIAMLKDPIGKIHDGWSAKSGLKIEKISVPLGVIAMIYESRPNVTAEVAALAIKSANGCALKGGKEAINSNLALANIIKDSLGEYGGCIEYFDISRDEVLEFIRMDRYIDLVVPRGGEGLVKFVSANSSIPVLKHDKGVCHIYVHKAANIQKALDICVNAKCSRPGVCNAAECVLVDESIAADFLPLLKARLDKFSVKIHGCQKSVNIIDCFEATDKSYYNEYLDFELNLKIVDSLYEALDHIDEYSSGHSEAIISDDYAACEEFLSRVDSACVYANASTRFSDGGEFGFGAEVGISTCKMHARGPVGVDELTTYKYIIRGDGEIR